MEDRDSDADNSDTGSGGPVTVDVGDPFADFVHNEFVPGSISDTKSPVSQRCKRKPKKASSIPSRRSETRPRKRSHPDPSSVQQNVSV